MQSARIWGAATRFCLKIKTLIQKSFVERLFFLVQEIVHNIFKNARTLYKWRRFCLDQRLKVWNELVRSKHRIMVIEESPWNNGYAWGVTFVQEYVAFIIVDEFVILNNLKNHIEMSNVESALFNLHVLCCETALLIYTHVDSCSCARLLIWAFQMMTHYTVGVIGLASCLRI